MNDHIESNPIEAPGLKTGKAQPVSGEGERIRVMAKAMENSPHPFLIGDSDGRIIHFNQALCQLTGFSETELRSMNWYADLIPMERGDQPTMIKQADRGEKAWRRCEREYCCRNGSRVPGEICLSPYQDQDGVVSYYIFINDLSDKNLALQRLRQSEIALRQMSEHMLDMYKKVDANGLIQYMSPSHKNILGYDPDSLLGTLVFDLVHPEDRAWIAALFHEHLQKRLPARAEYRCRHAEGHYLYLETIGNWLWEGDEVTAMIMVSRDVSDRKQAERALLQSEDKFSKVFLYNPDMISICSLKEGRYIDVNPAYTLLTGYESDEVIGRTVTDLGIWVDIPERERLIQVLREHGCVRGVEAKFRIKSGEIITGLVSMAIIEMQGQENLLIIVKNITERKCFEEALRLSEERFFKAFNANPLLMIISSFEDGRIIDVNQSFCRISGYSRDEVLGRSALEMGIWQDPRDRMRMKQTIIEQGSAIEQECRFVTKSGELFLGLYSAERIEIRGETCLLSIVTDLGERRRIEREITRLDRMNLVGQMAASIGHEIRNPMTTVRGFLQLLMDKADYGGDREIFELMIGEMDRANLIIKEYLSLAKDKLIQPELRNINAIISNMYPLFQADAMAQDKNIDIRLEKVPDLLLDDKEIRQLMLNLVRNGLEAMEAGGNLTIKTFFHDQYVVLSIRDQGQGMSGVVLEKLGTPFFTTKEDGTGLGLAVCYGIARRHGAEIEIDTSPSGTSFNIKFLLPCMTTANQMAF